MSSESSLPEHKIIVLLIDDQPMVGEMVRRMLVGEPGIEFHYCKDGTRAIAESDRIVPTVILQDLVMPDVTGLELVKQFREHAATKDTPLIVLSTKEEPATKAEAFALGANDYLVKLPDRIELVARIRHHSRGYINLIERNEAYLALRASQKKLADDVAQAARYVRSLLPPPLRKGPIRTEWRLIPSASLGGDSFGYHALDDDHFALYLLDVCGHGVGSALLSVSALNALRSQSLPQCDFRRPGQVLNALNKAFQMDQQDGKFFTIWYGVLNQKTRVLEYSGGGHPPALVLTGPTLDQLSMTLLDCPGPMVGAVDDLEFETLEFRLDAVAKMFLYSDGIFEIKCPDGSMWPFPDFVKVLGDEARPGTSDLDRMIKYIRDLGQRDDFVDDVTIVEFEIPAQV